MYETKYLKSGIIQTKLTKYILKCMFSILKIRR